jgi:DNA-binding NarL/FixJ family response regulator
MGREPEPAHTILICDDNPEFRALLGAVVDSTPGMSVVGEAADGEAAISEAQRLQPDLILLDLAMPRLTGLDALPRLRQAAAATKIIVLSGFSTLIASEQVLALGANHYLEKGADPETIIATIEHAAAHSRPINSREEGVANPTGV